MKSVQITFILVNIICIPLLFTTSFLDLSRILASKIEIFKPTKFKVLNNQIIENEDIEEIMKNQNNIKSIGSIISQHTYVKKVTILRILPKTLHAEITEYKPIFIHENGELIDHDGFIIPLHKSKKMNKSKLIKLSGKPPIDKTKQIITMLEQDKELFKSITNVEYIGNRRFNIILENKTIIKLPQEEFQKAWEYVILNKEIFSTNPTYTLDLRLSEKIFVKQSK